MNYILKNATMSVDGREFERSIVIHGPKIAYTDLYNSKYEYKQMNAAQFLVAPGHVMIDFDIIHIQDFCEFKERMRFLQNIGCTTFITAAEVNYETEFLQQLKKTKHALINSCLDFVVGLILPINKISPTIIRLCRKHKVPIIFLKIDNVEEIKAIPWQRIRDELFPYHVFILPIWSNQDVSKSKVKKAHKEWLKVLTENKITTNTTTPSPHTALPKEFLLNIGLYPQKGALHVGSDADYLLFQKKYAEIEIPEFVFSNGKIKKAGTELFIEPGCGREIIINVPRKFIPIKKAFQPNPIYIDYD